MDKLYDPRAAEPKIYKMWLDNNCFKGIMDPQKEPFSVTMPPPNITGQLHLGHAMDNTLQDILVRWKRMQGYAAVWVPGIDHAGIATQSRVEDELRKNNISRYDLGREEFVSRVWDWKLKFGNRIIEQLKLLGISADWDRLRFTMDNGCSDAVREVFVSLYEKGLIYKGSRVINWCPKCNTALSDAEVEHEESDGKLWHINYPLTDGSGFITIATTRPETMLGDAAVAVNPNDPRYAALIGKTLVLPLVGREIPIIADDYVETEFGTGCVKVTPCHDPNDFECGIRHNLPHFLIMDSGANIINGGKYNGLNRYDARTQIIADLQESGSIVTVQNHTHSVGKCYRCGTTVEPLISDQWFVKMEPLAKPAIDAVKTGRVKFVPERFAKVYFNWMENVRDWCVSRQLWWGHQIPAWYCKDCGHVTVSRTDPDKCGQCGGTAIERDPDVLDTWFSSALWPFEVFGWPNDINADEHKRREIDYWYPTSVVCPGYEIIFFWVARMIFSGLEHAGDVPFRTAFIHGIVRDDHGRKMSKSLGNGTDPQDVITAFGADALRMNIVVGVSPGNDTRYYPAKCESFRNFANKLWNAARFIEMQSSNSDDITENRAVDRWILSKYNRLVREVNENLDGYDIGLAASKIYEFIWNDFCDWYIEFTKTGINRAVITNVFSGLLKLLHPFMPFVTEEIWQQLNTDAEYPILMLSRYPEYSPELDDTAAEAETDALQKIIKAIRNLRAEKNVPPNKRAALYVNNTAFNQDILKKLAFASDVIYSEPDNPGECVKAVTEDAVVWMPVADLVDLNAERARIKKELDKAITDREKLIAKLGNGQFTAKAPEHVVNAERDKLAKIDALIKQLSSESTL